MAFWSDANFEVKRSFRWQVLFGGGTGWKPYFATKVTKPSFTVGETKHNYLSHVFWYPGQVTWNDVTLTLVDPAMPGLKDMSQFLMEMLGHSGYVYPDVSAENGLQTMAKSMAAGDKALGSVVIQQFKGDMGGNLKKPGTPSETVTLLDSWTLKNAWIKEVKFGELDYSSEEMVTIDVTLKYDWALLGP